MKISLRGGSRLYLNGAVIRVDRKVNLELLNDVVFLLESHIMQACDANTPIKQVYFSIQSIMMDPKVEGELLPLTHSMISAIRCTSPSPEIRVGLDAMDSLIRAGKLFEALKCARRLSAIADADLQSTNPMSKAG